MVRAIKSHATSAGLGFGISPRLACGKLSEHWNEMRLRFCKSFFRTIGYLFEMVVILIPKVPARKITSHAYRDNLAVMLECPTVTIFLTDVLEQFPDPIASMFFGIFPDDREGDNCNDHHSDKNQYNSHHSKYGGLRVLLSAFIAQKRKCRQSLFRIELFDYFNAYSTVDSFLPS